MFEDNKYVVDGALYSYAKLHKRHTVLSLNRVRGSVAYNMVAFHNVSRGDNPDGIISKHWRYTNIWGIFQPLIFCMGDTIEILYLELKRGVGQEKGG